MRSTLVVLFWVLLVAGTFGCGALSAAANPKAAWALNEPAPMSVVVRRAEVARTTALAVKRLLDDTGIDPKSAWVDKVALSRDDAKTLLEEAAADPVYRVAPMRIVPAEAWAQALTSICSSESAAPNLMALMSPEVEEQYADVTGQEGAIAELKLALDAEQKALDAEGVTPEARKQHREQRAKIEKQISAAEGEHDPKVRALLQQIRTDAGHASPAAKEKLAKVVPVLLLAVEDAKAANAAAMIRYPLAVPGMSTDVQASAKRFAADVIEERTGTRPSEDGLKPDIKLEGADVKLTLNGVPADKLGKLSIEELVSETTKRTKAYVERVLGLAGRGGETQDLLSFESDLLGAIQSGVGAPAVDPSWGDLAVQSNPNGAPHAPRARAGACGAASRVIAKADKHDAGATVAKSGEKSAPAAAAPTSATPAAAIPQTPIAAASPTAKPAASGAGSSASTAPPQAGMLGQEAPAHTPKSRAKVESTDGAAPSSGPDLRLMPAGK